MKHEEAICQKVRFLRLKKLAAYYDVAAIRRAVNHNREKYGKRYPDASAFLARLDEWEKKLARWTGGWNRQGRSRRTSCASWWNCGKRL